MIIHKKTQLLLGAHMSIAGGFEQAIIKAASIGCTCLQLFTKSNRQWHAKPIAQEDADLFIKTKHRLGMGPIVAHASYLINIGSSNKELCRKSINALKEELHRCNVLEIPYLVVHPGVAGTASGQECCSIISQSINEVLETYEGNTMLLLENMAGQGSVVGSSFEQLASIYQHVKHKKKVGFCIDTCHAFAAGYDIRTQKGYDVAWKLFDTLLGLENLKVIHLNDSKKELGSHVDRHEHIGKGTLGIEAFALVCNDKRFFDIPKILETPKTATDLHDDARNIETLKETLSPATKKLLHLEK